MSCVVVHECRVKSYTHIQTHTHTNMKRTCGRELAFGKLFGVQLLDLVVEGGEDSKERIP